MRTGWLFIIILLVAFYVIFRMDLIPDVFPVIGWLDDTFLVGLLIYYFRYKKLPGFLMYLGRLLFQRRQGNAGQSSENRGERGGQEEADREQREQGRSGRVRDPYAVLGIRRGASRKEIQAAYREAVQKYHPDKVSHLGEEFQDLAKKKFVEIQQAYDQLMGK
ncbi:MAG: DnaJ domain-containing protein [Desulfosalsimonadaceae bacterium]